MAHWTDREKRVAKEIYDQRVEANIFPALLDAETTFAYMDDCLQLARRFMNGQFTVTSDRHREDFAPGREHLTISGQFQSDKYPWCPAGFVPLKISDPWAQLALIDYVMQRPDIDMEFRRDVLDAITIEARRHENCTEGGHSHG